jgi:hypothetical protein
MEWTCRSQGRSKTHNTQDAVEMDHYIFLVLTLFKDAVSTTEII